MKFSNLSNAKAFGGQLAVLCAASCVAYGAFAKDLTFDKVFSDKAEPSSLHYQATYQNQRGEHQLEVWRDGQQRLKRCTDDSLETYATRAAGDTEFQMSVLDLKKKIHTRVDRTNLYRIGNFTDWYDLAHGLRHPKGDYQLAAIAAPVNAPKALDACRWYGLTQQERTTQICWSERSRIPLLILDQDGKAVWTVTKVERRPISSKVFVINDEGFIKNDANQDIEKD